MAVNEMTRGAEAPAGLSMKGASVAYTGVTLADLAGLLKTMLDGNACWGLVQRPDRIAWLHGQGGQALLYFAAGPEQARQAGPLSIDALLNDFPSGRAFDARREWRWHADGVSTFAVLGLSEDARMLQPGPAGTTPGPRLEWQVAESIWRLTGSVVSERKGDPLAGQTWFETRFPRPLVYPLAHDGDRRIRMRLVVRTYADASGAVQMVRFCRLRTEKE